MDLEIGDTARKKAQDASVVAAERANASVPVLPSNELRALLKMQSAGLGKVRPF